MQDPNSFWSFICGILFCLNGCFRQKGMPLKKDRSTTINYPHTDRHSELNDVIDKNFCFCKKKEKWGK